MAPLVRARSTRAVRRAVRKSRWHGADNRGDSSAASAARPPNLHAHALSHLTIGRKFAVLGLLAASAVALPSFLYGRAATRD